MESKSSGVRLKAGRYYTTDTGSIVGITAVRGGIASGFFLKGHVYNEWHEDGTDTGYNKESGENINNEVLGNETWTKFRRKQRRVPRRQDMRELNVA